MKKVLILFGGMSSEHEVSCRSAATVLANIDRSEYEVRACGITRDGRWYLTGASAEAVGDGRWKEDPANIDVTLSVNRERPGIFEIDGTRAPIFVPDVIFPVLHGAYGEDGAVQGLCEYAGIPYVGPGLIASANCLDKIVTKMLTVRAPVEQVDYLAFDARLNTLGEMEEACARHFDGRWPVFIKPANCGSSVGISRCGSPGELMPALRLASSWCERVIAEAAVRGRELEVAVYGSREPVASRVGEIIAPDSFYTYEEKYDSKSRAVTRIATDLAEDTERRIREAAVSIFKLTGCKSLARVDFFLAGGDRLYFNEVNTMPGFTSISMYPKLMADMGMDMRSLISGLLEDAIDFHNGGGRV